MTNGPTVQIPPSAASSRAFSRLAERHRRASTAGKLLATAMLTGTLFSAAAPLRAASDCAVYTATMKVNGNVRRIFTTPTKETVNVPAGAVLEVRGTFTEFDVALDTFAVSNDVLTGAPAQHQITNQRTGLFASKVTNVGLLSGTMDLELDDSGQNIVMRRGGGKDLKIQAKDCDQGGIFQLEPEPSASEFNILAPGFRYCYQANRTAKRYFTNGIVLGYDSPELASFSKGDKTRALWTVQGGGRIGAVLGEDAVQAIRDENPAALAACPNQTPGDN